MVAPSATCPTYFNVPHVKSMALNDTIHDMFCNLFTVAYFLVYNVIFIEYTTILANCSVMSTFTYKLSHLDHITVFLNGYVFK